MRRVLAFAGLAAAVAAVAADPPGADPVRPSTREMAALLQERAALVNPMPCRCS